MSKLKYPLHIVGSEPDNDSYTIEVSAERARLRAKVESLSTRLPPGRSESMSLQYPNSEIIPKGSIDFQYHDLTRMMPIDLKKDKIK